MDFAFSEEEEMVVESAKQFAVRTLGAHHREHEAAGGLSDAAWEAWDETGLDALAMTSADLGVSLPARVKTLQALAHADGAAALALWSRTWLQDAANLLGAGECSPTALGLVADLDELTQVPWSPTGGGTELLVLDGRGRWGIAQAQTEPVRSLGLDAAGPSRCTNLDWQARGEADHDAASKVRALTRLWTAALLVGIAEASKDYVVRYVQERVAFGKAIAQHQGVAFLVAEMAMAVEGAELLASKAAWDYEQGRTWVCTDAYLEAVEAALLVTERGVQLLGGHGYMKDHPVEKWMRDARALSLLWGGVDAALEECAMGGVPQKATQKSA